MPTIAFIGLGSNQGDKLSLCKRAIALLEAKAGRVTKVSSFYCTEPVGFPDQEDFLNAVVEIETGLSALALLAACHVIEEELGRTRFLRWGPRTIDLDILLYGDAMIASDELIVPHPRLTERGFVLTPLAEIAPKTVEPRSRRTIAELLQALRDPHRVVQCEPEGTG